MKYRIISGTASNLFEVWPYTKHDVANEPIGMYTTYQMAVAAGDAYVLGFKDGFQFGKGDFNAKEP